MQSTKSCQLYQHLLGATLQQQPLWHAAHLLICLLVVVIPCIQEGIRQRQLMVQMHAMPAWQCQAQRGVMQ